MSRDLTIAALRGPIAVRLQAGADLRALLLTAAGFELERRRHSLAHMSEGELRRIATEAAEAAMMRVIAELDTFPGRSRFTTWACKFVLHEAAVKARRHA